MVTACLPAVGVAYYQSFSVNAITTADTINILPLTSFNAFIEVDRY